MTSNTTPSGECSASSYYSDSLWTYEPWKAFDGIIDSNTDQWMPTVAESSPWIQYQFTAAKKVKAIKVRVHAYDFTSNSVTLKIQGSNNGTSFTDLTTAQRSGNFNVAQHQHIQLDNIYINTNETNYLYYRVRFPNQVLIPDLNHYLGIEQLQFYGRQDV